MGYPHITDHNLSHSSNPNPTNHGDLASNGNEQQQQQQQPLGSSRWNPTPEQLMTLEELYRRGTRTPSAAQIQQIAMRLRRFGKIEGKNVFYWFQNHKARERQKRRRQLDTPEQQQQQCDTESLENKESSFEIEPMNKKGSPSNKDFISTHGNEWSQIHEKELRMDLSSSPIYLTNSSPTASSDNGLCEKITTLEEENRQDQTLELFPLGSNDINDINNTKNDTQVSTRDISTTTTFTPSQYFEFLPLKN